MITLTIFLFLFLAALFQFLALILAAELHDADGKEDQQNPKAH